MNKYIKVALLVAIVLALLLSGCGEDRRPLKTYEVVLVDGTVKTLVYPDCGAYVYDEILIVSCYVDTKTGETRAYRAEIISFELLDE